MAAAAALGSCSVAGIAGRGGAARLPLPPTCPPPLPGLARAAPHPVGTGIDLGRKPTSIDWGRYK